MNFSLQTTDYSVSGCAVHSLPQTVKNHPIRTNGEDQIFVALELQRWFVPCLPLPVSLQSVVPSTVQSGSNSRKGTILTSCMYNTRVQSRLDLIQISCSSQLSPYRELPAYEVHQIGRATARESTLLEQGKLLFNS